MRLCKTKTRVENGKKVVYEVYNESYDDEYGRLVINYVPYRTEDGGEKKQLSPPQYALSQWQAEEYLQFGRYRTCPTCKRVSWEEEA